MHVTFMKVVSKLVKHDMLPELNFGLVLVSESYR